MANIKQRGQQANNGGAQNIKLYLPTTNSAKTEQHRVDAVELVVRTCNAHLLT